MVTKVSLRRDPRDGADERCRPPAGQCRSKIPEEASYSGSGNVYSAANWSCNPDDTGMLAVGTTGLTSGADTSTALQYLYNPIPEGLGAPIPF
jgi:hypothetical protein